MLTVTAPVEVYCVALGHGCGLDEHACSRAVPPRISHPVILLPLAGKSVQAQDAPPPIIKLIACPFTFPLFFFFQRRNRTNTRRASSHRFEHSLLRLSPTAIDL